MTYRVSDTVADFPMGPLSPFSVQLSMKIVSIEWEPQGTAGMSMESRGYLQNAGTGKTARKNREAFSKWSIVPQRLVKTSGLPDLSTTVLGEKYPFPIAVAPIGVQHIFHPQGEPTSAAAAAEESIPYIISTASSTSIEDLYWPSNDHNDITLSILSRAKRAGFTTLFVTLDTYILGWRPFDMENGYNPFLRDQIGVAIGFTDPIFRSQFKEKDGIEIEEDTQTAGIEWTKTAFPGLSHGWEDLKFLQENWDGPIVLKGIQTIEDAKRAVEYGGQGIVVSNHGGRQVDGGVSSMSVLPRIVDAVGDRLEVLFDSGIGAGVDIAKALALGAKMVLIGRPIVWGLELGGQEGVRHVLKSLLGDLQLTLHVGGIRSVNPKHLNRSVLEREDRL